MRERLELADQEGGGARIATGRPLELPPCATRVELKRDEQLVVLRDSTGRLHQLDVGRNRRPGERHGGIALGLEVPGQLVAVRGHGPLDPLHAPDRRALASQPREYGAPAGEAALLVGAIEQAERADANREHRRIAVRAPLLDDADLLAPEWRTQNLDPGERGREHGRRLELITGRADACAR